MYFQYGAALQKVIYEYAACTINTSNRNKREGKSRLEGTEVC